MIKTMDSPFESLGFPKRTITAMNNIKYLTTVKSLTEMHEKDILKYVSRRTLEEILKILKQNGLSLKK